MSKWIAEFELEDGDRMPEHMDLEYHGVKLDFHCRPLEQEPCEDAVSRTDVVRIVQHNNPPKALEKIRKLSSVTPQEPNTWSLDDAREDFMHDVYNTLDFLPTNEEANRIIDSFDRVTSSIEQAPKKGHWVTRPHVFGVAYCSECDFELRIDNTNFCPNCGADMREV